MPLFLLLIHKTEILFPNPNKNSTTQWRIFSSYKSAPANRKKGFLYEAAQNF
jgi:hypothetical protein